jgi:hypothetical protein
MYAVIKTGSKQHKVSEGDVLSVEKLVGGRPEADQGFAREPGDTGHGSCDQCGVVTASITEQLCWRCFRTQQED